MFIVQRQSVENSMQDAIIFSLIQSTLCSERLIFIEAQPRRNDQSEKRVGSRLVGRTCDGEKLDVKAPQNNLSTDCRQEEEKAKRYEVRGTVIKWAGGISLGEGSNPQTVTSTIKTNNLLCSEGFEQNLGDQAYLQAGPVPVINQSTPDAWQMIWENVFRLGYHSWGNIYQPLVVY